MYRSTLTVLLGLFIQQVHGTVKNIMIIIMEYLIKSHYNQEFTFMMQKLVFHLLLLLVVNTCLQIKLVVLPMCVMTGYPLVKKIVQ